MKKSTLNNPKQRLFSELKTLYIQMENSYNQVADKIGLDCKNCQNNCCLSYFKHHTYLEWAYLWEGLKELSSKEQQQFIDRAEEYLDKSRQELANGQRPAVMCPLNQDGWCYLYQYRLMICRLHGVPNKIKMPDGSVKNFPGCHTCQQLTKELDFVPQLDRTPLYIRLANLEKEFLGHKRSKLPRVNMTIAEMLVQGPPSI